MARKPKIEPTFDYHLSSAFKDKDIIGLVLKGQVNGVRVHFSLELLESAL